MKPSRGNITAHLDYLDGWRAAAIIGVLIAHFVTDRWINLGRYGVEMFFVLSGVLMADILFIKQMQLPLFFGRRVSRVYPALFAYLGVIALVIATTGAFGASPLHLLSAATFTYNYAQIFIGKATVINHIWTLCVEEHTYILLALIAVVTRRAAQRGAIVCLVIAAVAMAWGALQTLAGANYTQVYWRSDVRCASILLGAAAYLLLRHRPVSPMVPLAGLAISFALSFQVVPDPIKYSAGTAALAVALATLWNTETVTQFLSARAMALIGLWSYSIYLWQQPFPLLASGFWRLSLLPAAIPLALASYYLLERPSRRAINSFLHRWVARLGGRSQVSLAVPGD